MPGGEPDARGINQGFDRGLTWRQKPAGGYAHDNCYWRSYAIAELIAGCDEQQRQAFEQRVQALQKVYDELSDTYQRQKGESDIPLK